MEEREIKIAVDGLEAVRQRLTELGADCFAEASRERNSIFDRDGEIYPKGKALRLRVDGRGVLLTFKGRARYEDGVKVRQEIETRVEDAEGMRGVLEALGYRRTTGYEKVREEWRLDSAVIALDHTPIGDFVEVEAADPAAVAERLGLDLRKAKTASYLRLYAEHRALNPDAPEEMSFP